MSTGPSTIHRTIAPLAGVLYLAALVVFLDQGAILGASLYQVSIDSAQSRFGAIGLAAGRATPFLLADLLWIGAAVAAGHRLVLKALGVLHLLVAVLALGALALFSLDSLEVRQGMPLDVRTQAMASALRAGIAMLAVALFCLWTGVRVLRATPAPPAVRSADRRIVVDPRGSSGT